MTPNSRKKGPGAPEEEMRPATQVPENTDTQQAPPAGLEPADFALPQEESPPPKLGWRQRAGQWRAQRRAEKQRRELEDLPDRPEASTKENSSAEDLPEAPAAQAQEPAGAVPLSGAQAAEEGETPAPAHSARAENENTGQIPAPGASQARPVAQTGEADEENGFPVAAAAGPAPTAEETAPPRAKAEGDAAAAQEQSSPEELARKRARRRRRLRRVLPALLATVLYAVLAFLMFRNAADARRPGVALSLRYNEPLAAQAVAHARYLLADPEKTSDFSPAFWYESEAESLTSTRGTVETPVLFVDGDMANVYRVEFLYGTYPSALETAGLAVSEDLAWELFGGVNIVGAELDWNKTTYTVRGVFKGNTPLVLAQVDAQTAPVPGFTGVELLGSTTEADPRDAAAAFAAEMGLGEPDAIAGAATLPDLLLLLAWLPAAVLIVWFAFRMLGLLRHVTFWKRQLVWLALLVGVALLIPRLLALLPGWVIPNRWSDFEHWSAFFKEVTLRLNEWLGLRPFAGDIQGKKQLIWQLVLMVPALFAMASVIRRWGLHMRRREAALLLGAHRAQEPPPHRDLPLEVVLDLDGALEETRQEAGEEMAEEQDDILALKQEREEGRKRNPMS